MEKINKKNGYVSTIELLKDHPEWLMVIRATLEEAKSVKNNRFAGAWILNRAKKSGVHWIPNFRKLVSYGILKKDGESTQGGRRAYYSMLDIAGVEKALEEFSETTSRVPYSEHKVTRSGIALSEKVMVPFYANLASCGSPNDAETHVDEYIEVSTEFAKPGYEYFLVKADGDSMNLAGINSGDVVLIKSQNYANFGDKIVACTNDGITIKEYQRQGNRVLLVPRSDNPENKPLLVDNLTIQGVVVTVLPSYLH